MEKMSREKILLMARKASRKTQDAMKNGNSLGFIFCEETLEEFAEMVTVAEREACAETCDKLGDEFGDTNAADCAFAIRERGAP